MTNENDFKIKKKIRIKNLKKNIYIYIGATIRTRQEIQCLPYAGFFVVFFGGGRVQLCVN